MEERLRTYDGLFLLQKITKVLYAHSYAIHQIDIGMYLFISCTY